MNKDLEIIKNNLGYFMLSRTDKYGRECAKNIINLAAERMAEEIARLKAELEKCKEKIHHLYDINSELAQANSDTNFQLNFFKAELAGRPEVVMCGDCKHKEWCRKSINQDGHGDMCPVSFCSAGQRRESEVKDGKE